MSKDLLLYESGNGGNLLVKNSDITLVESLYQQCYLALFGGNLEANTTGSEIPTQIREDWWANSLLNDKKPNKQFNSNTERVLDKVALNTSGRIEIERAVEDDLKTLRNIADFTIKVIILSTNKVTIEIVMLRPGDLDDKSFQFIWDNAAREIITEITI